MSIEYLVESRPNKRVEAKVGSAYESRTEAVQNIKHLELTGGLNSLN